MIEKFLPRTQFDSYEDFKANYRLNIPENFNFSYDVIDEWARRDAKKPALVWVDGGAGERRRTFMNDMTAETLPEEERIELFLPETVK